MEDKSGTRVRRKRVSKRSKSSWRKHTDLRDIEGFLDDQRRDERTGGPASEKTNEELFFVDVASRLTDTAGAPTEKRSKRLKALRCHSALLPDPNTKPVRVSRNVRTSATAAKKQCKQKKEKLAAGILSQKEKQALLQRAKAGEELKERKKSTIQSRSVVKYDLWGDADITKPSPELDDHYVDVCKLRRIRPPVYYHNKPSGASAVEVAAPGASYNPAYDDHQNLLSEGLKIEEVRAKEERRIKRALDEKFPMASDVPNEETWLKEMSVGLHNEDDDKEPRQEFTEEELCQLSNNPPVHRDDKKTEKERRKLKEAQMSKKNIAKAKQANIRKQEIFRLKSKKKKVPTATLR